MENTRITIDEDDFAVEEFDPTTVTGPFNCILCIGVAFNAVKCSICDQCYCLECLFNKNTRPDRYGKYHFDCYMKCGSKSLSKLTRIEKNILNGMNFTCQ